MTKSLRYLVSFTFLLLIAVLIFGVFGAFSYLYPRFFNEYLPFYQLRPMHVSAALFWIIGSGVSGILFYRHEVFGSNNSSNNKLAAVCSYLWIGTVVGVFFFYGLKKFGGREYWAFPPVFGIPLLAAWICLMFLWFRHWWKAPPGQPLYVWMWSTGIVFFFITFLEQNLYHIPWFRTSFLREITVQWKSNGAMVGAWNQMIYGTSIYVMVKISKDPQNARSPKAFFFYFLGLTNLMFNWGHHIYNVPTASWIRHVSYAISMTEWILFISIIRDFKSTLAMGRKYRHLISYRFLSASEFWVFMNLLLALFMSIPAINRYTHGTHITVAHAMGTTIGINTMILLSSFGYMLRVDALPEINKKRIHVGWLVTQISLFIFWAALVTAGVIKGYRMVALQYTNFDEIMAPAQPWLHVFAYAGIVLVAAVFVIVWNYGKALRLIR